MMKKDIKTDFYSVHGGGIYNKKCLFTI